MVSQPGRNKNGGVCRMSEKDPLLFTKELVKSEYVASVKSVSSARTRLRNAKGRHKSIVRVMHELGYTDIALEEESVEE